MYLRAGLYINKALEAWHNTYPVLQSAQEQFYRPTERAVNLNCNHFALVTVKSSMANPNCLLMTFLASPYLAGWAGMDVSS